MALAIVSNNSGDKPGLDGYQSWLVEVLNVRPATLTSAYYQTNADRIRSSFLEDAFWVSIVASLRDINAKYLIEFKEDLFGNLHPEIVIKPFSSLLEKTYRKNVVLNQNWPDPPEGGWYLPSNWFSRLGDIVRTTIAVRYIDGVNFLSEKVSEIASGIHVSCDQEFEAGMDGYYALHLCYRKDLTLVTEDWKAFDANVALEIQITTEVKRIVKSLLHVFYERSRLSSPQGGNAMWDYKSDHFAASNLGHMVHYIEGMLVQLRDRQVEK